jgi:hypothetical protein
VVEVGPKQSPEQRSAGVMVNPATGEWFDTEAGGRKALDAEET